MNLRVAKTAGFCFGVSRAMETVYKELEKGKVYTYGEMIHNKEAAARLETLGAEVIHDIHGNLDKLRESKLIIRAHGAPPEVFNLLGQAGIHYIDCTCPCVSQIHRYVEADLKNGYEIIIFGEAEHPEIIGTNGFAGGNAIIAATPDELRDLYFSEKKYSLVAQTTFNKSVFGIMLEILKDTAEKQGFELVIRDTICRATSDNQREADEVSKDSDVMLVLGDKGSSNTRKLFDICNTNCPKTFYISNRAELLTFTERYKIFGNVKNDKVGIIAGASTPPDIIKEAVTLMSELEQGTATQENFEEMLNESLITLHTGDVVKGTVIQVANGEVSVNLGYKSDGVILRGEFSEDPTVDPADVVKPGDEVTVFVVRVNDGEGNVQLSRKKLAVQKGFLDIENAFKEGTPVSGKVTETVKGGLIAMIGGVRAFVPSSQISSRFIADLSSFVGQELNFNILEFEPRKKRIVAGRKELAVKEAAESKQNAMNSIVPGTVISGTVSRLAGFGAFVDLGGADGLIHVSEMSWKRITRPEDVLKVGDCVEVMVLDVDKEKGKISLSLRAVKDNPWTTAAERYPLGSIITGTVVRMTAFGAFVELEEAIDGMIHISQISDKHIAKPSEALKIGDVVEVKVMGVDVEAKRISLSKKAAESVMSSEDEIVAEETAEQSVNPSDDVTAE